MVASFVSRANSGYTNRSDDRKSMASLASMMSGRVRLPSSANVWAAWAARKCPLRPAKGWCAGGFASLARAPCLDVWGRAAVHCCVYPSCSHAACSLGK